MKLQRFGLLLTLVNFVMFVGAFTFFALQSRPTQAKEKLPILRGRGLEIVDSNGKVRASISVEPAVTVDGKRYPETVLLRLTDPKKGPLVKITAAMDGSAIGLSDDKEGGVQLFARDSGSYVRVVDDQGNEQVVQPGRESE